MYAVEVIADDLTGAMDTAQGFAARGYATTVIADPEAEMDALPGDETAAVLGVNTDSRYDDETEASTDVRGAIAATPARTVYKKVDSTLRGNVATEVDAALTASGAELALVAPAFPSAGRTTRDGIHYVDGTPVAETEYGDDEKGPIASSIAALFASVDRPVEHVTLSTVTAGRDAVAATLADAAGRTGRAPIVVCDAQADAHLASIAAATDDFETLYVGSGGLAEQITVPGAVATGRGSPARAAGAPLGVAGSVSATTLAQLDHAPDDAVIAVDGAALVAGDAPTTAVEQARRRLRADQPAILTAATDDEDVAQTLTAGRERGLEAAEVRDRVAAGLAAAARDVLREAEPSGLVLTGGDIAIAVIRELGATAVTLTGDEVEAGIPIGTVADGTTAGLPLITKAGGFGSEVTIVNCLDAVTRTDE